MANLYCRIVFPVDFLIILCLILVYAAKSSGILSFIDRYRPDQNVSSARGSPTKSSYVNLVSVLLLVVAYYKLTLVNTLYILLCGILLPLLGTHLFLIFEYMFVILLIDAIVVMLHAILRKRNLANKVSNILHRLYLRATPMAIFLEKLGLGDESKLE